MFRCLDCKAVYGNQVCRECDSANLVIAGDFDLMGDDLKITIRVDRRSNQLIIDKPSGKETVKFTDEDIIKT